MASIARITIPAVLACLLASACASDSSGPGTLPSCGTQGTQLTLAVAAFTSIDPATDSGCVTFAANTSPDTVEYLVLPWSAGGNPGSSAPFALESATPLASITAPRFVLRAGNRGATPAAFDRFLRHIARTRNYTQLARAAALAGSAGPQWAGSGAYVRALQRPGAAAFTLRFSNGSGSAVTAALVPRLNIVRIR